MTLKKCTRCGKEKPDAEFYFRNKVTGARHSMCKLCTSLHKKERYAANPASARIRAKIRRVELRAVTNAESKNWRIKNPEKRQKIVAKWAAKHPDVLAAKMARRRAIKRKSIPKWFESEKVAKIYLKAKELNLEVDHVVPLQSSLVCGLHCWYNLQLLDRKANVTKGNRYWPDMP